MSFDSVVSGFFDLLYVEWYFVWDLEVTKRMCKSLTSCQQR